MPRRPLDRPPWAPTAPLTPLQVDAAVPHVPREARAAVTRSSQRRAYAAAAAATAAACGNGTGRWTGKRRSAHAAAVVHRLLKPHLRHCCVLDAARLRRCGGRTGPQGAAQRTDSHTRVAKA